MTDNVRTTIRAGLALLRQRPLAAVLVVAALLLGAGLLAGFLYPPSSNEEPGLQNYTQTPASSAARPDYQLKALDSDAIGVEPGTSFVLTSSRDLQETDVAGLLRVEPQIDVQVSRESAGRYLVRPAVPLDSGKVYRFEMTSAGGASQVDASWAFQTKSPIRVVQTLPRDQATQVPRNTGIELTFSHDGIEDLQDLFQISPPVQGRFEVHKRVIVFVPKQLQAGTLYSVTIRQGASIEGTDDTLAEDYVFQFETGGSERSGFIQNQPQLGFTRKVNEAGTQETPALELFTSQENIGPVSMAAYAYPTILHFLDALQEYQRIPSWAYVTRDEHTAPTQDLERVVAFETELQQLTEYGHRYASFEERLPEGFYLIEASAGESTAQTWLQITDVATYVAVSQTDTLAWVNDLATEGPLADASVLFIGTDISLTTNADGLARGVTPDSLVSREVTDYGYVRTETVGNILISAPDGRSMVVPLAGPVRDYRYYYYGSASYQSGGDYWRYISRDRPVYRPADTVRFWGIARPRDGDSAGQTLTARLTGSSQLDYYYRPVTIAETEVESSPLGTYTGELSFEGVSPGYYQLNIYAGEQFVDSTYVSIRNFTKPAYSISVEPDSKAVFQGDTVEYGIEAAFLEGSPVPDLKLNYRGDDSGTLTTDDNGRASLSITANGYNSWPSSDYISVTPALAEQAEITGEAWVWVFPSSLYIDAKASLDGGLGVIEGTVTNVDLSRINGGTSAGRSDFLGAPAGSQRVTISVTEVTATRHDAGEYYDFIAKLVRKRYTYTYQNRSLGDRQVTTAADGTFRHELQLVPAKRYELVLRVVDGEGRAAKSEPWFSGRYDNFNGKSQFAYLTPPDSNGSYYGGARDYELDDDVVLEMRRGADVLPDGGNNRYLFYHGRQGLRATTIQDNPILAFDFGEEHIPSSTVQSVWFNGRTYVEARYGYQLRYNPAARDLQIEITPDQERYEPGDTATLAFRVLDAEGNPQAQTEINISVVDEALFLVQGVYDYTPDLLQSLYSPVGSGVLRVYASHQYPLGETQAERGGGGGPREDFADLAFYGQVVTDEEGQASVSFELPDNLTSWRVTTQAFNAEIKAGSASRSIPVSLPFFVEVTMSDEYLVDDVPWIKVRSFGTGLERGTNVTFELTAPSLGLDEPLRTTALAFESEFLPFPDLIEGEHELLISGTADGMEDALIRKITVVTSRLLQGRANFYELEAGLRIEGSADGYTTVSFSDHERGRYLSTLLRLTWGYGDRVDQMLARDLAADLLDEHYDRFERRGQEFNATPYQTPDGGISLLPYSDDDLTLTARLAALAPERFGTNGLAAYFLEVAEDENETRERQLIALYGLASLGEPMLLALDKALALEDLTWRERLYLGLAALELGDDASAASVLESLIDQYGEVRAPYYRLRVGVDQDDVLEATSLAAILAGGLDHERASKLFDYTGRNYTEDLLVELEQISFLTATLPRMSVEPVRFAYELDGERHEIDVSAYRSHTLRLSAGQLASIRVEPLDGRVGVSAFFDRPLNAADASRDGDISLRRSYRIHRSLEGQVFEGGAMTVEEGQIVEIRLMTTYGTQALDGCYQVTDAVPSGLLPITNPRAWGLGGHGYAKFDGQKVSFCLYDSTNRRWASYFARVVSQGDYVAEPATMQSRQSRDSFTLTGSMQVAIR